MWKMEYFGLKLGQDLVNRAAHPYQEFRGVPPGTLSLCPCLPSLYTYTHNLCLFLFLFLQTHPNIDKKLFNQDSVLGLKQPNKPFPLNSDIGVLRWRMQSTDEGLMPLSSKFLKKKMPSSVLYRDFYVTPCFILSCC